MMRAGEWEDESGGVSISLQTDGHRQAGRHARMPSPSPSFKKELSLVPSFIHPHTHIRTLRRVMPILLNFWSHTMRARSAPRSFMCHVLLASDTNPSASSSGFSCLCGCVVCGGSVGRFFVCLFVCLGGWVNDLVDWLYIQQQQQQQQPHHHSSLPSAQHLIQIHPLTRPTPPHTTSHHPTPPSPPPSLPSP
jgi:hypothetical protein